MGNLYAASLAEEVGGLIDLRSALHIHLRSNHYPPVPTAMIEPCVAAIEAVNEDDWDREIDLTGIAQWRGNDYAPAWAIVEGHHLGAFVGSHDDEED
jgi:hypothetical protein